VKSSVRETISKVLMSMMLLCAFNATVAITPAYSASSLDDRYKEITDTNTKTQEMVRTNAKTTQGSVVGWLPLLLTLAGIIYGGVTKYKEAKQQGNGYMGVLGTAILYGFIGAVVGFALVYIIGLLTGGGGEALDKQREYWK
jgi:hypothetical protein